MSHVLAAIDESSAMRPVLRVARWFGELLDFETIALHVAENGSGDVARAAAEAEALKFEIHEGAAVDVICAAAVDAHVRAVVVGARGVPAGQVPAGQLALQLIQRVSKPVVVVPPEAKSPTARQVRLLAPVNDLRDSADAVRHLVERLHGASLDLILLRVFDAAHMPRFADHSTYDTEDWGTEFARRTVPAELARTRVEMRVGNPAHEVLAAERELEADLVVCGWACDLAHGHANVIKRLLAHATTPIVLVPYLHTRERRGNDTSDSGSTMMRSSHASASS